MSVSTLPGVHTVAEAAGKARVSVSTMRREITAGRIQVRRIGRCVRILDDELARYLREQS